MDDRTPNDSTDHDRSKPDRPETDHGTHDRTERDTKTVRLPTAQDETPAGTAARPAAFEEPRTRTGLRVRQLVADVKADLSDIENVLRQARQRAARLEEEGRGINGLSAACRGWGQQLAKILEDVAEESAEVERTMLGKGPAIATHVDEELHERVRVAREA